MSDTDRATNLKCSCVIDLYCTQSDKAQGLVTGLKQQSQALHQQQNNSKSNRVHMSSYCRDGSYG